MGTKNNPGKFDCYANAEPDEPMFILLGRDPVAHIVVRTWVILRRFLGTSEAKLKEAEDCADQMGAWARKVDEPRAAEADRLFMPVGIQEKKGLPMAKKQTFAQKKEELLAYLKAEGWEIRTVNASFKPMVVPHATSPDKSIRLWFKPQAIYHQAVSPRMSFDIAGAHSISSDMRSLDGPLLVALAERFKSS